MTNPNEFEFQHPNAFRAAVNAIRAERSSSTNAKKHVYASGVDYNLYDKFTNEEKEEYSKWITLHRSKKNGVAPRLSRFSSSPPPAFVSPDPTTGIHSSVPPSSPPALTPPAGGNSAPPPPAFGSGGSSGGSGQPPAPPPPPLLPPDPGSPGGGGSRSRRLRINQAVNHKHLSAVERDILDRVNQQIGPDFEARIVLRPSSARVEVGSEKKDEKYSVPGSNKMIDAGAARNLREKVLVITEVNSDGRPQRTPTYFKLETSSVMGPDLRTGSPSVQHDLVAVQNVVMVPTMILNDTTRGTLPTIADARSAKTGDRYLNSADVAVRTIVGSIKHQSNSTIHDRFNELTQHFPTISPDYRGLTQLSGQHLDPNQRKMAAGLTSYVSFERGPNMQQSAFDKLTSPEWMSESGYMEGASASTHAGYTARERRHVTSKDVVLAINAAASMQGGLRGSVALGLDDDGNPLTYTSMKIDEGKYAGKSRDDRLKYASGQIHKREAVAQRQGIIPSNTSPLISAQHRENIGFVPQEGFAGILMLGSKVMASGGVDEAGNPLPEFAAQIDPVGSGGMVGSTDVYRMRGNASFADEVSLMPKSASIRDLRIVAGRKSIIPASGGTIATWGKNVDSGETMESRMPSMGNRGGVRVTGHILSFGNDELSARHIRDLLQDPEWTVEKIHKLIKDPSSTTRGTENFKKRIEIEKRAVDALNKIQKQDIQDRYDAIDRTGLSPQEIADLEKEKRQEIRGSIIKYDRKAVGGKRDGTALISSTSYIQLPDSMKGGGFKAMLGHVETDPRSRQILKSLVGGRNPEEISEKELNEVILPRFVSEMGLREGRSQQLSDEALQRLVGDPVKNILFGKGWQEMRMQQDMEEIDQRSISDAQKNRLKRIVKKKTRAPLMPVLTMTHDEIKYTRDLHLRTLLTYMQHTAPDSAIGAGKAPDSEFTRHVSAMGKMIRAEYATPGSKATGMDLEREIEENIRSLGGTEQEAEQAFGRRYKTFANIVENAMDYGGRPWILTSFPHVNAEPMGTTNMVNAPFMRALLKSAPELRDYLKKNSTAVRNISQMLAPEAWGEDEVIDIEAEDLKNLIPSTAAADEYERFEAVKRIYDSARKRENKTRDAAMRLTVGVDAKGNKNQIVLASPYAFASLERSDPGTTLTRIVEKVQNPGSRASGASTIDELENIHRKAVQQYAQSDAGQKSMQNFSGGGLNAMALRYISSPSASPGKVLVGKQDIESVASGFGLTAKALIKRMRAGQKFHVYVQRYPQSEGSGAWYELEYRRDYKGAVAVPTEANSQFAGDDDGDLANFMAGFRGVTYKKDGKWHNEFVPLPGVESAVIEQGSPKLTALNRFASFYGFHELGNRVKEARLIVEKYMKDELEHTQEFQDHLAAQYGKIDAAKDPEMYRRAFETERDRRTVDALVSGFNFVSEATNRGYHVSKLNLEFAGKEQNTQLDAETKMIPVRPGESKSVRSKILANALGQQSIAVKPQVLAQQSAEEGAAKRDMGIYTIVKNLQYTAETPEHLAAIEKASFNLYGENLLAQLGESIRPHKNPYASSSSQALSDLDWVYQRALDMLPKHQQTKDFAKSFFVSDVNTTEDLFERKRMTEELLSAFLQSEEVTPIAIGASFAQRGNAEQIEKIASVAEDIKREIAQKRESGKEVTHKDLMSDVRFRGIIEGRGYATTAYAPDADSAVMATITQQAYINTIARINKDGYENLNLDQKKKINEALQRHREKVRTQPGTFRRDWEIVSSMSREKDPTGFWSQAVQAAGGLENLENMDPITLANALGIKLEIPETESPRNNQTRRRIVDLDNIIQDPVGEFTRITGIYSGVLDDRISLDEERQSLYRQAMGSPEQVLPGGMIVEGPQRGFNARASSIESIASFPDSPAHQDRAGYRMGGSGANVYKASSVFEVINQMAVDLLAGNRKNTIHFRDSDLPHGMTALNLGKNEYTMLQQTNRSMRAGYTYEEELKKLMQAWNPPNSSAAFLHMSGFGLSAVEEKSRVFFSGTPDFFKASWKPVTDDKGNVIDRQFSLSVYDAKSTSLGKALKSLGFSIDDIDNISEDKIRNAGNSADFGVYSGQLSSYVFLAKEMAKKMRDEAGRAVVRARLKGTEPDGPPPPSEIEDPATGVTPDRYKFTGSFDELDIDGVNVNSRYAKHINQLAEMLQDQNVNLVDKDGNAMTHRQIAINMMEAMAAGRIEEGGVIIKNDKNVINTGTINSSASSELRVQTMFKGAHMMLSSRRLPDTGDKSVRSMLRKFPEKARRMAASESGLAALGFMYHAVGIASMNKNELLGRNRETGEPEAAKNYADISPLFGVLRESAGKDPLTIIKAAPAPSIFDDENEPSTSSGYAKKWTTEDEEADETASILATMMQHSQLGARQIASMEYILRGFARKTNRLGDVSVQREGNAVVGRDARGIRGGFKYLFDNTDREYVTYKGVSERDEMADDITLREAIIGASADFSGDGKTAFISSAIEDRYMMPDGTRTNKLSYVATNVRDAINPFSGSADDKTNLSERFAAQAGAIERLYKVAGILDEDEYKTLTKMDNPSPSDAAVQELIRRRSLSLQQRLMDRHRFNYEAIGESSMNFEPGSIVGYDPKTGQIGIRDEYDDSKVTAFRLNSRMFSIGGMMESAQTVIMRMAFASLQNMKAIEKGKPYWTRDLNKRDERQAITAEGMYAMLNPDSDKSRQKSAYEVAMRKQGFGMRMKELSKSFVSRKKHVYKPKDFAQMPKGGAGVNDTDFWFQTPVVNEYSGVSAFKTAPDHRSWFYTHHLKPMHAIVKGLMKEGVRSGQWKKEDVDEEIVMGMLITHDLMKARTTRRDIAKKAQEEKEGRKYDPEEDKSPAAEMLKSMGVSEEKANRVAEYLTLMDSVKDPEWWKDVVDKDGKVVMTLEEKIKALPPEVRLMSTTDAMSHRTGGVHGFLNIFSRVTNLTKDKPSTIREIAESNAKKSKKDSRKILMDVGGVKRKEVMEDAEEAYDPVRRETLVSGFATSYVHELIKRFGDEDTRSLFDLAKNAFGGKSRFSTVDPKTGEMRPFDRKGKMRGGRIRKDDIDIVGEVEKESVFSKENGEMIIKPGAKKGKKETVGEFGQEIISPGEDGELYAAPNSAVKRKDSEHYRSQRRIRFAGKVNEENWEAEGLNVATLGMFKTASERMLGIRADVEGITTVQQWFNEKTGKNVEINDDPIEIAKDYFLNLFGKDYFDSLHSIEYVDSYKDSNNRVGVFMPDGDYKKKIDRPLIKIAKRKGKVKTLGVLHTVMHEIGHYDKYLKKLKDPDSEIFEYEDREYIDFLNEESYANIFAEKHAKEILPEKHHAAIGQESVYAQYWYERWGGLSTYPKKIYEKDRLTPVWHKPLIRFYSSKVDRYLPAEPLISWEPGADANVFGRDELEEIYLNSNENFLSENQLKRVGITSKSARAQGGPVKDGESYVAGENETERYARLVKEGYGPDEAGPNEGVRPIPLGGFRSISENLLGVEAAEVEVHSEGPATGRAKYAEWAAKIARKAHGTPLGVNVFDMVRSHYGDILKYLPTMRLSDENRDSFMLETAGKHASWYRAPHQSWAKLFRAGKNTAKDDAENYAGVIFSPISANNSVEHLALFSHEIGHYEDDLSHGFEEGTTGKPSWKDPAGYEKWMDTEARASINAMRNLKHLLDPENYHLASQVLLRNQVLYERTWDLQESAMRGETFDDVKNTYVSYREKAKARRSAARARGGPVESGSSYVAGELAKETYKGPAVSREGGWVKEDGIERWDPSIGDVLPISQQEYMRAWRESENGFAVTRDQGIALRRGPQNRYEDSSPEWNKAGYFRFWDPLRAVGEVAGIGARKLGALASVPFGLGIGFGIGAFNFLKGIRFSMPQGKGFRFPKISLPKFSFDIRMPKWAGMELGLKAGNGGRFSFSLPKIKFPKFNFFPGPDQDKRALHRGMLQDSWDLSMERDRRKAELAQNWASQVEGIGAPYDEEFMKSQDEELKNLNSYVDISPHLRERYKDYRRSSGEKRDGVVSSILDTINRGLDKDVQYSEEDVRGFMEVERWKRGGARTGLIGGLVGVGQNAVKDFAVDAVDFAKSALGFAGKIGTKIESFNNKAIEFGEGFLGKIDSAFDAFGKKIKTKVDFVGDVASSVFNGYTARMSTSPLSNGVFGFVNRAKDAVVSSGKSYYKSIAKSIASDPTIAYFGAYGARAAQAIKGLPGTVKDLAKSASESPYVSYFSAYAKRAVRSFDQFAQNIKSNPTAAYYGAYGSRIAKGINDLPMALAGAAAVFAKKAENVAQNIWYGNDYPNGKKETTEGFSKVNKALEEARERKTEVDYVSGNESGKIVHQVGQHDEAVQSLDRISEYGYATEGDIDEAMEAIQKSPSMKDSGITREDVRGYFNARAIQSRGGLKKGGLNRIVQSAINYTKQDFEAIKNFASRSINFASKSIKSAKSEIIGFGNRASASANASVRAFVIPIRSQISSVYRPIRSAFENAAQNLWYGNDYPNGKKETVEGFLKVNKALEEARARRVEVNYAAGDEVGTRMHQVGQHDDAVQSLDRISEYGYATDGDIDQAMEAIQNSPSMKDAGITREDVRGYFNARAIQSRGGPGRGGLRSVFKAAADYTKRDIQAVKDFGSRAYQAAAFFGDRALNTALVPINGAINRIARGEAPTFQDATEYLSNKEWFDSSDESDLPSHIRNAQRYFAGKTGLIGATRTAAQSARSLLSRGASFVEQAAGRIFPVDDEAPGTLYGPEDGEQSFGARLERGVQKLLWGDDTVREWRPGASYGQRGGETFADRYQESGGFSGILGTLYNARESFRSSMFGNKGFMEYFMGIDIVKKGVNAAKSAASHAIGAVRIAGKKVMDSAIGRPLRAAARAFDSAVFEAKGVYSGVMGKKTYTRFGKGIHALRRRFGLKNEGDYRVNKKRGETKISAIERVLGAKGVALKDATPEQMDWARTVLGRGGDPDTPFPESKPAAPAAASSTEAAETGKKETAEEKAARAAALLDDEEPETKVEGMDDEKPGGGSSPADSTGPDKTDAAASEEDAASDKAMQELLERMFPDGSLGTVFSGQFGSDGVETKTDVARIVRAQLFGTMKVAMKMGGGKGGLGGLLGGMFGGSRKGATGKWKFSPAAMRRLFTKTVKDDKGVESVVARDDFADDGGSLKLPGWNNEDITKMLGSREIGTKEAEGISHLQAIGSRGHRATMENFDQGVKFLEAELAQSAPGSPENEGIANMLKTVRNMRNAKMIMGGRTSATTMSGLTHDEVIQKAKDINASAQAGDHTADFKKNMKAFTDELIKGSQVMKGLNDNIDKLTATTKSAYDTVKSVAETRDQMKRHADTLEKAGYGATKEGREAIALAREKQYEAQAQLNKGSDLYESIKSKHGEKEANSLFDEFDAPASKRASKWRDPTVAAMSAHFVREFSYAARESFGQLQHRALLGAQQEEQERSRLAFVGESIGSQFDPGTRYAGMKSNWDRGMNKDAANLLGAVQSIAGDASFSGLRAVAQVAEPMTSAGMLMATLNQSGIAKIGGNVALPIMAGIGIATAASNIFAAANNPWAMAAARAMKDAGGNPYSSSAWEGLAFTMTGDKGADTEWYKQKYQDTLSKENEIKKEIAEQQKIVDSGAGKELSDKEKSQIESLFKKRDIYKSQLGQGSTQYINTVQEIDDLLGKSGGAQAAYIAKNKIAELEKQLEKAAENTYEARTNLNVAGVAAFAATEATPLFRKMPEFDKTQDVDSLESGKTISSAGMRMFADLASRENSPSDFRRYAFERGVVDTSKQIEAMQVAQIYAGRSVGPRYAAYYQAAINRISLGENLDETMGAARRLGKAMGTPGFLGGGRYFADQTITGTFPSPAQMYDATENAEGMNAAAIAAQVSTYTGVPGRRISRNLERSVFGGVMDSSMAATEGKIAFAREMFAADAERRKAAGESVVGLDVDAIMFGDSTFDYSGRNEWFRSGSIGSASEFVTRTGFTKGGHIKAAALEMLAQEGDAGMQRMEKFGINRQAFQAMGMADRTGYATKYTALAAMGDPFAASVMYAGFNQMSPQLKQSLVTSGLSPMFDMSSGDRIFNSSMDGAIYRTQSMEMTSGILGYGQPYGMPPTFGMVNGYASIVHPDQSAMSESKYLKLAEANVSKITEYWDQQSSMSPMASRVNMSAADKDRVSRSMAGLTNSVMVNGQKRYVGGPQSLQMDANRAAIASQLASAGASYDNLVAQREYELAIERPDALYQLNQQYASFFGGTVASPFSKAKKAARKSGDLDQDLGGGVPNQLNFGRGQYEYQRLSMDIQRRDMEANFAQNMTRMGWQQADLYKERGRTLVRANWQREDFALQREQTLVGRDMQSYGYAFQAREMGITKQQYREDYAYNKRMRQMRFGWQMEDADINIRRATGFERKQLIKQKERETIAFNEETGQEEKVNKRQEEAFKREEEKFKKELDHYKKTIALEDVQFSKSVKRFEQEQKWQEQDFNTQIGRLGQEAAWQEESFARQMERFNLEKEQFELQKNNQQVLFDDQMVKQQAAFDLSDRTHKNNLAAAGAAARAAKLAAEAQDHMERAGITFEKMMLALRKFAEGVKWEEVSKAMDNIIAMYKIVNRIPGDTNTEILHGHADGGYINTNRSMLVGERGPEIITVDKNGKPFVIPNSAIPKGRSASGVQDQVIHIHVMMDSNEIATYTAGKANNLAARNRRRAFNG